MFTSDEPFGSRNLSPSLLVSGRRTKIEDSNVPSSTLVPVTLTGPRVRTVHGGTDCLEDRNRSHRPRPVL